MVWNRKTWHTSSTNSSIAGPTSEVATAITGSVGPRKCKSFLVINRRCPATLYRYFGTYVTFILVPRGTIVKLLGYERRSKLNRALIAGMDPENPATEVKQVRPSKKRKKSASAVTHARKKAAQKARETFLSRRGISLQQAGTTARVAKAGRRRAIAGAESAIEEAITAGFATAERAAANALAQVAAEAAARADMEQVAKNAVESMRVAEEKRLMEETQRRGAEIKQREAEEKRLMEETQRREAEIKQREAEEREVSLKAELQVLKGKEGAYGDRKSSLLCQKSRMRNSQQEQPLIPPEDEDLYSLDELVQLERHRVKRLEKDVQNLELANRELRRRKEALRPKVRPCLVFHAL